jgi:hypothetical protein
MLARPRYVMQDQVRDRVRSIMRHDLRRGPRRADPARARWLALVAAVAYTAAATLTG